MKIALCGSMDFMPQMRETEARLREMGYDTEYPNMAEGKVKDEAVERNVALKNGFITEHFGKIDTADAVLVVNIGKKGIEGYIGGNTLMEMTYAFAQGLEVFLTHPLPEMPYTPELNAMRPLVIDDDLTKIDAYFASLPRMYVSSKSPVKLTALSRAMRRAGNPVLPIGHKTTSGVNEQPLSVDETLRGAMNRQAELRSLVGAQEGEYLATIESGNDTIHAELGFRGLSIVMIEQVGGKSEMGLDVDIEFPQEFAKLVPSEYPDFGVLMQQKFGTELKDPYPYITKGKLTRTELLEEAAYRVAVQL